jgi:hypothetical protein
MVGVDVAVGGMGVGVRVGPRICPAPQPEASNVTISAEKRIREVFIQISLLP